MSDVAVRASGVCKRFVIGEARGGYELLSERIGTRLRRAGRAAGSREFWALRDVDFEVRRGETFGIVGHNGAGKSTLLKVLSRVTPPTRGEIDVFGRVGALLEVGTGFHPELTGAENVYLNGAILGLRRSEVARRFDEIVAFAEVEEFINTPVKRYSSGMYLRLAFAVAAHLEPEVLIVDEVLSVGDLAFQRKCLGRMRTVAGEGRTVLFVSHNLGAVQSLCPRSMLLSRGRKVAEGPSDEVIAGYLQGVRNDAAVALDEREDRTGSGRLRFRWLRYEVDGEPSDTARSGDGLEVVLGYRSADGRPVANTHFSVTVYGLLGEVMLHLSSDVTGADFEELPPEGELRCVIPRLPLPAGGYWINVYAAAGGEVLDWVQHAAELTVTEGDFFGTGREQPSSHQAVLVEHSWRA